jgi:hypothetical protein
MTRSAKGFCQGAAPGDGDLANSHPLNSPREHFAVDAVSITEQIRVEPYCTGTPRQAAGPSDDGRGMFRDVQVDEFAAVMPKDDEDQEQAKREGRDDEEVDGHDIAGMGGAKSAPRGRGPRRRPMHVLRDREFGEVVAEQGQFRPDAPAGPTSDSPVPFGGSGGESRRQASGGRAGWAWTSTASRAGSLGGATPERWRGAR